MYAYVTIRFLTGCKNTIIFYIGPKINRVKKGLFWQYETTKTDIKIQGTSGAGTPER